MTRNSLARAPLAGAAALLALATIAGALGAHALPPGWSVVQVHVYMVAVRYQFYQSLGLLGMGVWLSTRHPDDVSGAERRVRRQCAGAALALLAGIVLFSGSLYALSLRSPHWVGFLTPVGGALMIIAWVAFAAGVWRS